MIDATLLMKGTTVFSPWFPRQADMLIVTAELIAVSGATLTIKLYQKNKSDPGDGTQVGSDSIVLTSASRGTQEWETGSGVEQLLRFEYSVTGTDVNDWALFRLLPASWFDAFEVPTSP